VELIFLCHDEPRAHAGLDEQMACLVLSTSSNRTATIRVAEAAIPTPALVERERIRRTLRQLVDICAGRHRRGQSRRWETTGSGLR